MSTGQVTRRTTWVAAAAVLVVLGAWALLIRAALGISVDDRGVRPTEVLVGALIVGWPHALAAATAIIATARAASGVDGPARLLALVSSGRRGHRDEWGAAMRAELASITGPRRERLRFAVSCAPTALRRGWGWSPWIVAVACGTLFAALTVATSRLSLHGNRSGSLWGVLIGPPQIALLLVGFVAAWKGCSMRNGLEHAVPALIAILVGVVAAAGPEGALWAREAGVFILDGDYPSTPLTSGEGAHDALQVTLTWGLLLWLPWPVLGAAAGAQLLPRATPVSAPTLPPSAPPPPGAPPGGTCPGFGPVGVVPPRLGGAFYGTGLVILLSFVTIGIWCAFWTYRTKEDLKKYNGDGIGGVLGVVIFLLLPVVLMFTIPSEIKSMYERDGRQSPVSAVWGLWFLLPLIGQIVWYVKVQRALNDFWLSKGAQPG